MRADVRGLIVVFVLLAGCGVVLGQSQDIEPDPPDHDSNGPGGGDDPTPWPMLISILSSGPVALVQGPDTGIRYLEHSSDGTFTVNLGGRDVFRTVWNLSMDVPSLKIENMATGATGANNESIELTWYDAAGAILEVVVLAPGDVSGLPLDQWARVEIRDGSGGRGL